MKFHIPYLIAAILLFFIEVCIAVFVHDDFVRPYIGDVLVVMLIYCVSKSLFNTPLWPTALFVLLFAFVIEGLQYLNIVTILGLQHSKIARTVIGTSFEWFDLITYTGGIVIILIVEYLRKNKVSAN